MAEPPDLALLRAALANAPVGLALFDREHRFVQINQALASMSGRPIDAHLGHRPTEVHPGTSGESVEAAIDTVFATGEVMADTELTSDQRNEAGVRRTWLSSWFPVDDGGEVRWAGVVVIEITERRRAVEHLARLQSLTARLSDARDPASVARVVVAEGGQGLGAVAAALALVDEEAGEMYLLAQEGMEERTLSRWSRFPLTAPVPACDAVATGEMVVLRSIEERDERYPVFRGTPTPHESFAVVPLQIDGRPIGALSLSWAGPRAFDEEDRRFLAAVADQCAQSIERARLADAQRAHAERQTHLAETLQRSLLPPSPLVMAGMEVATRYHPVGDGSEVGGDFYDLFALGEDRWGLVMGDVSGKGVPAASLTALARHTVRAAATWETSPSGVLRVLNRAILDYDVDEQFCTIVHGQATLTDDRLHVVLSCGGHPLPLVLAADGTVTAVGEPGTGIGLFPRPDLTDTVVVLGPGDSLVLFTDGVVEARSPEGGFEPELLEKAVAAAVGATAAGVADAIEQAVLRFEGGVPRDDMAVLVVRVPPAVAGGLPPYPVYRADYPAEVESVPRARRDFVAWFREEIGEPADAETVLILAELVANAARAARTGFEVRARVLDDWVEMEVVDDGPGLQGELPPPDVVPEPEAEQGRGLYLVRLMADELSIASDAERTRARVRRRLPVARRPPPV